MKGIEKFPLLLPNVLSGIKKHIVHLSIEYLVDLLKQLSSIMKNIMDMKIKLPLNDSLQLLEYSIDIPMQESILDCETFYNFYIYLIDKSTNAEYNLISFKLIHKLFEELYMKKRPSSFNSCQSLFDKLSGNTSANFVEKSMHFLCLMIKLFQKYPTLKDRLKFSNLEQKFKEIKNEKITCLLNKLK